MTKSAFIKALSCVLLLFTFPSCGGENPANPPVNNGEKATSPHDEIIGAVTSFIGEPQNWQNGSKALAQFVEATSKLRIGQEQEVLAFRGAALDLMGVQIQWTSLNTKSLLESTKNAASTVKATGEASIGLTPVPRVSVEGSIKTSDELGHAAKQVQSTVSNLLSKEMATQFTEHYGEVLDKGAAVIAYVHQLKEKPSDSGVSGTR